MSIDIPGDHQRHAPLRLIPGSLPDPTDPPRGCRFRERCAYAVPECRDPGPAMTPIGPDHLVACVRPVTDQEQLVAGGDLVGR